MSDAKSMEIAFFNSHNLPQRYAVFLSYASFPAYLLQVLIMVICWTARIQIFTHDPYIFTKPVLPCSLPSCHKLSQYTPGGKPLTSIGRVVEVLEGLTGTSNTICPRVLDTR